MSLERHWQRVTPLSAALYPLSLLFGAVTAVRRAAYAGGLLRSHRVAAPVVVVGNITVGGTGKTPLVLWIASFLRERGKRPGIVSRGYGGSAVGPMEVRADARAAEVGDEPLLLARRSDCPVWISRDRVAAAQSLLAAHPECDVVISDDGLQHYRLARDVEIAVIDGARGLGNELLLPAGPLREPPSRLRGVDAIVANGDAHDPAVRPSTSLALRFGRTVHAMQLSGARFRNLREPARVVGPEYFEGKRVCAIAGIGHPPRFFAHLESLGITFESRGLPDHHAFSATDLAIPSVDEIVMTEKDAVKCAAFASSHHWVLPVEAEVDPALGELVMRKLEMVSRS